MHKFFFVVGFVLLLGYSPSAEARHTYNYWYDLPPLYGGEVHPYDQVDRRHGSRRRSYRSRFSYRSDPYFRRTETHALHPYYRKHYHDVLTVSDTSEYGEAFRDYYHEAFPFVQLPSETNCREYGFYKGHNRLPPKDFECFRP